MEVIRLRGGQSVQEIQFNSVPDILFELGGCPHLISEAEGYMIEASDATEAEEYDKVVEYYCKAWEAAYKSIGAI